VKAMLGRMLRFLLRPAIRWVNCALAQGCVLNNAKLLRRLDADRDHTVFVGHDLDELDGAGEFGLRTVAFNYAPGARADRYAERFSDLMNLLD